MISKSDVEKLLKVAARLENVVRLVKVGEGDLYLGAVKLYTEFCEHRALVHVLAMWIVEAVEHPNNVDYPKLIKLFKKEQESLCSVPIAFYYNPPCN